MEKNCLITELNGIIDNQNMPYFNSINLFFMKSIETPSDTALSFRLAGKAKIFTDDNHVFYVNGSSTGVHFYDMDSSSYVSFKGQNEDYNIAITPRDISTFQSDGTEKNFVFDVNEMSEVFELLCLSGINTCKGQKLKESNAGGIDLSDSGIIVDLDNFIFKESGWHSIYSFANSHTKGNFSSNESLITACSKSGPSDTKLYFNDTMITGNIETFAAAIVAKGTRPNNTTITVRVANTSIIKPAGTGDTVVIRFNSSLPNGYSIV